MTHLKVISNPIRAFVAALSTEERNAIIESYLANESNGIIPEDSPMRKYTMAFMEQEGILNIRFLIYAHLMVSTCFEKHWLDSNDIALVKAGE